MGMARVSLVARLVLVDERTASHGSIGETDVAQHRLPP